MCQQGCSRPYWKPSVKGMLPLQSLIFLAGAYTNCKNAACNACSENAKGSLRRCVAQTSFWAEMQKKGTAVSSAFPRSARRGRGTTNGENLNISGGFIEVNSKEAWRVASSLLAFLSHFLPFHPSRIPTALPSSSVTMYNPVPIFLTDPAWRSRIFPTVPMLSVTGRPRGYEVSGGSPWG